MIGLPSVIGQTVWSHLTTAPAPVVEVLVVPKTGNVYQTGCDLRKTSIMSATPVRIRTGMIQDAHSYAWQVSLFLLLSCLQRADVVQVPHSTGTKTSSSAQKTTRTLGVATTTLIGTISIVAPRQGPSGSLQSSALLSVKSHTTQRLGQLHRQGSRTLRLAVVRTRA